MGGRLATIMAGVMDDGLDKDKRAIYISAAGKPRTKEVLHTSVLVTAQSWDPLKRGVGRCKSFSRRKLVPKMVIVVRGIMAFCAWSGGGNTLGWMDRSFGAGIIKVQARLSRFGQDFIDVYLIGMGSKKGERPGERRRKRVNTGTVLYFMTRVGPFGNRCMRCSGLVMGK